MDTRTFTTTINETETTFCVRSPSLQDQKEASKVYNVAFSDALKAKAIVRAKLDDLLIEQGLWDEAKQNRFSQLQSEILDSERKLAKGGIKLVEAKTIALNMKKLREELRELISVKTNLDTHTAEGQADNARFNYLVSVCTVYNDSKQPYFKNYEDYNNRSSDIVAILAAQQLANMIYGLENDYESKLPENKFLKQYKFVDDKLRLINNKGQLVDVEGKLIDANGRYINENGDYVDKNGNPVNKEGDYVVEFSPFLDDEGHPVTTETKTAAEEINDTKPSTQSTEEDTKPE